MTTHVVSRYWRAPELVLMQTKQKYNGTAVDVWSAGVIFVELLSMLRYGQRGHVFDADYSFPAERGEEFEHLSLEEQMRAYAEHPKDLLNVIFDVIGTPEAEDLSFLEDDSPLLPYFKMFRPRRGVGLETALYNMNSGKMPWLPEAAGKARYEWRETFVELVKTMLTFSPLSRATVEELLRSELFSALGSHVERGPRKPLTLKVDEVDEATLTEDMMRACFDEQIAEFQAGDGETDNHTAEVAKLVNTGGWIKDWHVSGPFKPQQWYAVRPPAAHPLTENSTFRLDPCLGSPSAFTP